MFHRGRGRGLRGRGFKPMGRGRGRGKNEDDDYYEEDGVSFHVALISSILSCTVHLDKIKFGVKDVIF